MYKSLRAQTLHYFARAHERVPSAPIVSPAAWNADAMRRSGEWQLQLDAASVAELKAAVQSAQASGKTMGRLTPEDFPLPTLAARLAGWRREIRSGRGFVLIRGVPVQDFTEAQSELCYWGMGLHLGVPGAQNPQGDLLGHVRDQRTTEDARFYRTNKAIAVHCDAADVVGLMCLKTARSGGLSRIASSVSVFNELMRRRPDLVPLMFQPLYFDTKGEGGVRAFPIAPSRYAAGELRTFWQSDYYRSAQDFPHVPRLSAAQRELLDTYDAIAGEPQFHLDMDLQPGDVQLISNHTILHARTAFEDWPEPERRRHLLRLWISVPEQQPLRLRLLRRLDWLALVRTAAVEILRRPPLARPATG